MPFFNQSRTQGDSPRIRNFRRLRFAAGIALLVALLSVTSAAQATITPTSTASDLASAVVNDPAVVTGASFVALPATGTPNAVSTTSLTSFPTDGSSYAILTTGDSTLADQPNNSGSGGVSLGGGSVRGDTDFDVTIVKIDLAVPTGANCLSLDFQFLSEEFPEFVGSSYNDAFIAELDSSTWTTSGSTISAPNNFAFDPSGDVISVNSSGATSMTAGNASGTTYDGATPLLSAATPITPGAHSLYISIFDQGDHILDSAVFVDNLILGSVGPGGCEPGATVLSTSKTADSGTTPAGGANGYTITVSNPSASAVVLTSISDTLPSGFTYTGGSTTGATTADPAVSGTLTWTGPFSVPAAGSVSLHFLVTVSSTPGEYFNDASADAGTTPVAPTGPTAKITVASGGTELAITKADAPDPVALGGTLTYTLTVTNNGPDPSTDSTVTDTLPAGVTFVSATPSQGTCSQAAGTVSCTLGPLAVGASATIEIVVTVDATAVCPLSDTATVTGVETDPLADNNSATASTACGGGTDLAITKADAPDPVALGGSLTYALTVTNNGPDPSTDSTVTDTLPPGVTFVSATPSQGACSEAAGTVTCTLGPLALGASATTQIVVTVEATALSPLSDTATVTGVETDPLAANNSATAETTISLPTALDHFKCYKTRQVGPKFDRRQVVLTDQFNTERVNVVRPDEFPKFKKERVEVTDQFGTHTLLLKKIRSLCLPSSKAPLGEVPGSPPTGLDHFKCYKTRQVGTKFDPRQVVLTDQFNTERVNVVRPEAFCTPVDKDGSGINDPSAHLACYKIRDVRGDEFPKFERRRVEVGDQFGTHTLLLKKTRTLCLPSSKTVL